MPSHSRSLLSVGVLAVLLLPGALGLVRTANRIIVPAGDTISEDLYAFGGSVTVEGTVDGDVFALTGDLTITGIVTGDVIGFAGTRVRVDGAVGGSVRVVSPDITVTGRVGDDLAALAASANLDAVIGRDVLLVAGSADINGTTGRDVRAQVWSLDVGGQVDGDVRVKVDRLDLEPGARVVGDVIYRASADAAVADSASIGGSLVRSKVFSPVWARAVERALAVLGLLGFVLAGLVLGWLFRGTARRAVAASSERPWLTMLVGAGLLVIPPLAVIPLSLTLVGLPLALLVAVLWLLSLFLGALPAVTWVGGRLLRGRGGPTGALVVGALLWRGAMWLLPLAAVLLYLAATVMGLGGLGRAAWAARRGVPSVAAS
jgi:cytoskeletal protein CcmA (bactofilin family)